MGIKKNHEEQKRIDNFLYSLIKSEIKQKFKDGHERKVKPGQGMLSLDFLTSKAGYKTQFSIINKLWNLIDRVYDQDNDTFEGYQEQWQEDIDDLNKLARATMTEEELNQKGTLLADSPA